MSPWGCFPSELQGRVCILAFSSFQRLPAFLGSWPLPPSSRTTAILSPLSSLLPSSYHLLSYKDPYDYIRPTWINQDNLPHLKILNLNHICKGLLWFGLVWFGLVVSPCKGNIYTESGNQDTNIFWEAIILSPIPGILLDILQPPPQRIIWFKMSIACEKPACSDTFTGRSPTCLNLISPFHVNYSCRPTIP